MLAKTKILTISPDRALLDFVQQGLNGGDYEVISTRHCGVHLRDIIRAEDPEFIILDIMMPTLDGIGTCLQLRQWTNLPIMMLSTWGTGNNTVRGLNLGSDSYLTEPFGLEILKKRIEETLKRKTTSTLDPLSDTRTCNN